MLGTGATIVFGTTGWTANILRLRTGTRGATVISRPHLGLSPGAAIPKSPGDLIDEGPWTIEFYHDGAALPTLNTPETVTITEPFPDDTSTGTEGSYTGSAFVSEIGEINYGPSEDVTGTFTLTWSTTPTYTPYAAP